MQLLLFCCVLGNITLQLLNINNNNNYNHNNNNSVIPKWPSTANEMFIRHMFISRNKHAVWTTQVKTQLVNTSVKWHWKCWCWLTWGFFIFLWSKHLGEMGCSKWWETWRKQCFTEANVMLQVQRPVRVSWAEVTVSDMCRAYVVQVRCMHINGNGYWSEWSESVYSTPQNSRGTVQHH